VWLGMRWGRNDLPIELWAKRAMIPAALVASVAFEMRHAISHGLELGKYEFLFDKWHLGPIRLLNFAAVAALLIFSQTILKPLAVRPLILMGQSSLQVFCVHLLCCFGGLTLLGNASMLSGWKQVCLLVGSFAAMLATAVMFSKSEAKNERNPTKEPPPALATDVTLPVASSQRPMAASTSSSPTV
jgi:hypothetical protein